MRRYTDRDLYAYGDYLIRVQDFADEYGESVIFRMMEIGGRGVDGGIPQRAECPDMPRWLWPIAANVAKLDRQQRRAVVGFYSAQLVDGQRPSKREIARELGMDLRKFREHLQRGRRRIMRELNGG